MLKGLQRISPYAKSDFPKLMPIAPAPEREYIDVETDRKKYTYKSNPYTGAQAASIARRNARERNRVKQVNDSFNALRKRLPASVVAALAGGARRGSGKKLSKVDTLRMVVDYIRHLQTLLDESDRALGVRKKDTQMVVTDSSFSYEDEGVYTGSSPYSESVPSPVSSECCSGVSARFSPVTSYYPQSYQMIEQSTPVEDDLFDAISFWEQK